MSKVRPLTIDDGRIASEKVARVVTADGIEEEVFVAPDQIDGGYLLLPEIMTKGDRILVELPRESSSGAWRLWISKDTIEATK